MIIENPAEFSGKCFALQNRDRVVRADGSELSFADLKRLGVRAVGFIAEPENNICTMELSSTEDLPEGYTVKTIRQSFFELAAEDDFFFGPCKGFALMAHQLQVLSELWRKIAAKGC
ncbi:MAG: hypothetical protein J6I79_08665 [Paludibacteraceae bacterium]|nr:hypothetical protein [Paludibacteraceae bacterium]